MGREEKDARHAVVDEVLHNSKDDERVVDATRRRLAVHNEDKAVRYTILFSENTLHSAGESISLSFSQEAIKPTKLAIGRTEASRLWADAYLCGNHVLPVDGRPKSESFFRGDGVSRRQMAENPDVS